MVCRPRRLGFSQCNGTSEARSDALTLQNAEGIVFAVA